MVLSFSEFETREQLDLVSVYNGDARTHARTHAPLYACIHARMHAGPYATQEAIIARYSGHAMPVRTYA